MNLCHARLEQGAGGLVARFGSLEMAVDTTSLAQYQVASQRAGQEVVLGMRTEFFSLTDGTVPSDQSLRVKVDLVDMLGAEALVYLQTDAKPVSSKNLVELGPDDAKASGRNGGSLSIVARISPCKIPNVGEIVDVHYEPDPLHFVDPDTGQALRSA